MEVKSQHHAPPALSQGQNPGTHWTGDWVGPTSSLNILEKIKISYPCQDYLSLIKTKIKISRQLSLSPIMSNHSAVSHVQQALNIHSCFFFCKQYQHVNDIVPFTWVMLNVAESMVLMAWIWIGSTQQGGVEYLKTRRTLYNLWGWVRNNCTVTVKWAGAVV